MLLNPYSLNRNVRLKEGFVMGMMQDTGAKSTAALRSITGTDDIAILLDARVNKYNPGYQIFKLQSTCGLQPTSNAVTTQLLDPSNLMNSDQDQLSRLLTNPIQKMGCVRLWLPITVSRTYPHAKFIPYYTRFVVSFLGGDLSKPPVIIRGEWEDAEDVQEKRNAYYSESGDGGD